MALPLQGQVNRHVVWLSCLCEKVLAKRTSRCLCTIFQCSVDEQIWFHIQQLIYIEAWLTIWQSTYSRHVLGCYFVSFKKPPHMGCVFAHCGSWCICSSPFHRAIAFSYTMHRLANFSRENFILTYSKLPCGNEVVIRCIDFPIFSRDGYVLTCSGSLRLNYKILCWLPYRFERLTVKKMLAFSTLSRALYPRKQGSCHI